MLDTLAVKYRPNDYSDVCEQRSVVDILNQQAETGNIRNCYLFTGPSGTGKTTIGRIFARKINHGIGEPIEIDAASNNGVDNVRDIVVNASVRSIDSTYKVYILDECHMFSNAAWNAFLKCIEEPPKYTVFIFCTTDPQKIPATILNRVMRFNLTRLSSATIENRLRFICENEHFTNYESSINYISKICDGSMRTAISYLDKVSSYSTEITMELTTACLGDYSFRTYMEMLWYIVKHDSKHIILLLEKLYATGVDLKMFIDQFLLFVVDIIKYSIFNSTDITKIPQSEEENIRKNFIFDGCSDLYNHYMDEILKLKNDIHYEVNPKSNIEIVLLQLARYSNT